MVAVSGGNQWEELESLAMYALVWEREMYNLGCLVGEKMRKKTQEKHKYEENDLRLGAWWLVVKRRGYVWLEVE